MVGVIGKDASEAWGSSHNGRSPRRTGRIVLPLLTAIVVSSLGGCDLPPRLDWPGDSLDRWTDNAPPPANLTNPVSLTPPPTAGVPLAPPARRWYRIDQGSRSIGAAVQRSVSAAADHRQRSYAYVGNRSMGNATLTQRVTCDATFDADGVLRSVLFHALDGMRQQRWQARRVAGQLNVQADAFGHRRTDSISSDPADDPVADALWLHPGQIMSFDRLGDWLDHRGGREVAAGSILTTEAVDWQALEIRPRGTAAPLADDPRGASMIDFEIVLTPQDGVRRSILTIDDDQMLRRSVQLAQRLSDRRLTTVTTEAFFEEQAEASGSIAPATLRLDDRSLPSGPLSRVGWSIELNQELSEESRGIWPPPTTDFQYVQKINANAAEAGQKLKVLTVDEPLDSPIVAAGFDSGSVAVSDADLADSGWIDFGVAEFMHLPGIDSEPDGKAAQQSESANDALSIRWRAEQSVDTVDSLLTIKPTAGQARRASEVLGGGQADRLEHAALLTALLRRQKIPARIAIGLRRPVEDDPAAPPADRLIADAWVVFHDGHRWRPIEKSPPGAQPGPSNHAADRLTLLVSDFSDDDVDVDASMKRINDLLGSIRIKIFGARAAD